MSVKCQKIVNHHVTDEFDHGVIQDKALLWDPDPGFRIVNADC
jgi:hypothetical protein